MIDWLFLAVWAGLLFGIVMLITKGNPSQPANPWVGQLIGLVTMTFPFTLYFALCESSRWQASIGKRVVRLHVSRRSGGRLSLSRAFLRNAIKFLPWEFGHTVAQQAFAAGDEPFPLWLWGPFIIAMVGPLWWIVSLALTGHTPYDRWTSARVSHSGKQSHGE